MTDESKRAKKLSSIRLPSAPGTERSLIKTAKFMKMPDESRALFSRVLYSPLISSNSALERENGSNSVRMGYVGIKDGRRSVARTTRGLIPRHMAKAPSRQLDTATVTVLPRPPRNKKPIRTRSGRERVCNMVEDVKLAQQKRIYDITECAKLSPALRSELCQARQTMFTGIDEKSLRNLILFPSKSSFLSKMYMHPIFNYSVLFEGGFQYLKRSCENPYHLEPAKPAEIDRSEFFTLSQTGITRVSQGESDFTTLEHFEHEYSLYDGIMKLHFFQRYRKWKNFTVWKKNIRYYKMNLAKRKLDENLFFLNAELSIPLMEIATIISRLNEYRLFHIAEGKTYKLDEFLEAQAEQRILLRGVLAKFAESVLNIMEETCSLSLKTFLEKSGFPQREPPSINQDDCSEYICSITFTERASMRTQCWRLMRFIQLVDFLVLTAHVNVAVDSTVFYLKQLLRRDLKLFEVQVRPNSAQTKLVFSPLIDDFKGTLDICIFDSLKEVSTPQRLLDDPKFSVYAQPAISEYGAIGATADVDTLIMQNSIFRASIQSVNEQLNEAFVHAKLSSEEYEPFFQIYLQNLESLKTMTIESHEHMSIENLVDILNIYREQQTVFEKIPERVDAKTIQINGSSLLNLLRPSPLACLTSMYELIPKIGNKMNQVALDELRDRNDIISATPLTTAQLVNLRKYLEATNERMYSLEDQCMHVMKFFEMMEKENIGISEELSSNNFMMYQLKSSLGLSITRCEDSMQSYVNKFGAELKINVQKLKERITDCNQKLLDPMLSDDHSDIEVVVHYLTALSEEIKRVESLAEEYAGYQEALAHIVDDYIDLPSLKTDLNTKKTLWDALQTWRVTTTSWLEIPFETIDTFEMEKISQIYFKIAVMSEKKLEDSPVPLLLRSRVEDFKLTLPVIIDLRAENLKERHWNAIHNIVGYKINGVSGFSVGELIEKKIMHFSEEINTVAVEALNEAILEGMLEKVVNLWKRQEFEVSLYKGLNGIFILGSVEEVLQDIDDSLVTLGTVMGSRYVAAIREKVEAWQKRLLLLQETLDEWLSVQKNWMYLENIFAAPDIQRQLPNETKIFEKVDKSWKGLMKTVAANPNCITVGCHKGRKELFVRHSAALDVVQKRLEEYLETKRASFPRFYFLSNDELLEILAQTKDPRAVQPYLRKCFDNLVELTFKGSGILDITQMKSAEGEIVELGKNLKARGSVEEWLTNVEERMKVSLRSFMKVAALEYTTQDKKEWVFLHCAQCVNTIDKVMWSRATEDVLNAIERGSNFEHLQQWLQKNLNWLLSLTSLIRQELTKLQRKVIVVLATINVHARDIIMELIESKIDSASSFLWQKQLRYYWETETDTCFVRQSNAKFMYGYEYEGATGCLVITPLTDRCWMTISGALHLKLGASPAGPAGTGKTESSKDLAKALAVQCIVFNCSDQIDIKMMSMLFKGLSSAGAWTCLDEFNRIDIEVLSVIAQQMLVLRQARLAGNARAMFDGFEIPIRSHHVIITMNPGYAGRTELPDNLKVMFRPVAMMVPDYALIAEIMLFSEGFDTATVLSKKMTKMYKLSSEQLSQQRHYDYGMRAVKSVLVMAGQLKRDNPSLSEDIVLIKACRDSNLPKFLDQDLPLFHGIVKDLFPGVKVPYNDYGSLEQAIKKQIDIMGLQPHPAFIVKAIQLFETQNVRFGVCIVGPTGSGKTTAYQVLQSAMTSLANNGSRGDKYDDVILSTLNPKSVTMGELYGEFNSLSQEWRDGLASTILRTYAAENNSVRKWTVFDGPIDALWIENMNTVLDDNMTLCLANGERIKLRDTMKCLFEVQDLEVASPATVSRLGVMYMTPEHMKWRPYVKSWIDRSYGEIQKLNQTPALSLFLKQHLFACFTATVDEGLSFVRSSCKEPIVTSDLNLVVSLCSIFQACLTISDDCDMESLQSQIEKTFIFSFTWSLGGAIDNNSRTRFDDWMQTHFESHKVKNTLSADLPRRGSVYESYFKGDTHSEFTLWSSIVPKYDFDKTLPYFQILVPTVTSLQLGFLLKQMLSVKKATFITGITGTGKSVLVQQLLTQLQPPVEEGGMGVLPTIIGFSAQTNAAITQSMIENNLEKKSRCVLGAPVNKLAVVFVDDVNMPAVEEYGAQPPIELLRQFVDFSGFYDREKQFWKDVVGSVLVVAGGPPGGGRNELTPRFVRHFNLLCLPPADDDTMTTIFGSILNGFYVTFSQDVKLLSKAIVESSIEIFGEICETMLPTPSKAHYTFNLRDVSKVFQGILQILPSNCKSGQSMSRLWIHEIQRVFHDRLINEEDRKWFRMSVAEKIKRKFKMSCTYEELFDDGRPIIFGDFFKAGESEYCEFQGDIKAAAFVIQNSLEDYNNINMNKMNLVFFADAVDHVCRIARILRQPRGNALLIGIAGSGKQSLTRLSAFILDYLFFQIELTNGYSRAEFNEDIKEQMLLSGVEGKKIAWVFPDSQIVNESFVEDLNNVLNSGDIPNLWESDELDKIVDDMRPIMKREGKIGTRSVCLEQFNLRIRDNLHVVLSFSPVGDAFRNRLRNFPSLINCSTIDWFNSWPEEALRAVANFFMKDVELEIESVRQDVVEMCVTVHTSIEATAEIFYNQLRRKIYTTPKSYLDCIELYKSLLSERRIEVGTSRTRLELGVQKMEETNIMVAEMQVNLTALQPILVQKAIDTEALLKQVAIETVDAEKIAVKVRADEAIVSQQAAVTASIQEDAQKDLDRALPALKSALQALKGLDKKDITEMKSFANPPKAVKTVLEAVCVLLGQKTDWDTAKKVMTDSTFMEKLKKYDKDNIKPNIISKLRNHYLDHPDFQIDTVTKVSKAATSLCMWAHAMIIYDEVAKEVEPKRKKVKEMNKILADANEVLAKKQADLKGVLDRVALLKRTCDDTVAEKKRLADEADITVERLERAEKLTVGLADEFIRWKDGVTKMKAEEKYLIGDAFLAAAGISYYGPFTGTFRKDLMSLWREMLLKTTIPGSEGCTLISAIGKPVEIQQWQINSLPSDWVSTDNAIMCTRGRRWPLMIDPQGQANRWIKKSESQSHMEVTKMNNVNLLRVFESNIRNGTPVLIEDITEFIDPSIDNVLTKNTFQQGSRTLIKLGESEVEYDKSFRFYMTTKMSNPHYVPEICIKVTIINFTVTKSGLEDQLLARVVKAERPDIEHKKNNLVISMADDKQQLGDIENKILKLLAESTGEILDNVELINVLASSKTTSTVINERVVESEKTEIEINNLRNKYKPMAVRGSIIYFVIADFTIVDPMYQYSLEYYNKLFDNCLRMSEKSDDLEERLHILINYLTDYVYRNICRGLFERHKGTFVFSICAEILRSEGRLNDKEWFIFLKGVVPILREGEIYNSLNPDLSSFSDSQWMSILSLEQELPDVFEGLAASIITDLDTWKFWMESKEPHLHPLPHKWGLPCSLYTHTNSETEEAQTSTTNSDAEVDRENQTGDVTAMQSGLSDFQKLLLVKFLREEKLVSSAMNFVSLNLGKSFATTPVVTMADVYADTNKSTPCIFVLVSGADPTELLLQLAKSKSYGERLNVISLGQGQGPRAEAMIKAAMGTGDWVLLQNCHLAKSWMHRLELVVFELIEHAEDTNDGFRLFLTSFPAVYFPVSVLQNSIKMTNEPPQGLRANILRSFNLMVPEQTWEEFSKPDEKLRWKKLLFGIAFFHAMTQERRKFGPLGWNIRYEFNDSDLQTSIEVLRNFLLECGNVVPWDSLTYVTGEINYGGRVTDDWDRRCLLQLLQKFYDMEILNEEYSFSDSGLYKAPDGDASYDACIWHLKSLPLKDEPEIFGMHENANVASQMQETSEMIGVILSMQPRSTGGGNGEKSDDDIVSEIAIRLETRMPKQLNIRDAGSGTFTVDKEGIADSLGTVLSQELVKFNKLLGAVEKTSIQLQRAIKGLVVMSSDLETMYEDLMFNSIPRLWKSVSYDSLKSLAAYEVDLQNRVNFMREWLIHGRPANFPLYLFFFPQGFLTGVLQNHARQYMVPIDALDFSYRMIDNTKVAQRRNGPKVGVFIHGLWMEGARLDDVDCTLKESRPGEMFAAVPTVHFVPTRDHTPSPEKYICPVYKTTVRAGQLSTTGISTNFVVAIEMPTKKVPAHWVFEGVACILNLN